MDSLTRLVSGVLQLVAFATLLSAPWYLGGVTHLTHAIACIGGLIGLLLLLVLVMARRTSFHLGHVELVMLFGFALIVFQTATLPSSFVDALSPELSQLRAGYTSVQPPQATLSLAPAETRLFASRCWLAITFFLLGGWISTQRTCSVFLWAIVINGLALTLCGIHQRMGGSLLFWDNPDPIRDGFGPFVNKNNAAGYLCGCLAAIVGIIFNSRENGPQHSPAAVENSKRVALSILNIFMVTALLSGILFTLSRGAFLALIVGFVAIFPIITGSLRHLAGIGAALASTMLLLYTTGLHTNIFERIMKIDTSELQLMRGLHWQDDLSMIGDMWISGCGFGAYRFVNRVYQTVPTDLWFMYSENQYLETIASGGFLLLGILLIVIVICFWRAWQLGQSNTQGLKSFGIMGVTLIATQIVTASFDFGLFHSSNLILVLCLLGVVLGVQRSFHSLPVSQSTAVGYLILLLFLGGFAAREALAHANIERAMSDNAYRTFSQGSNSPELIDNLDREINRLALALEYCSDHPTGHAQLADMYVRRSRVRIYEQLSTRVDPQSAWVLTSPEYLASRIHTTNKRSIALDKDVMDDLRLAEQHFLSSNWSCPLLPRVHYRLGLIQSVLSEGSQDPLAGVKDCLSIVKMHSKLHLSGGVVAILTNDDELAATWLRRGLLLGGEMSQGMLYLVSKEWTIDRFIQDVMQDEIELTWQFLRSCRNNESWRLALCNHLIRLSNDKGIENLTPALQCYFADAHAMLGNWEEAEELYRSIFDEIAVTELVEFRFTFAKLLYRRGQYGEAYEHAELCLDQMPWHEGAAGLRDQLAKQLRAGVATRQ